jgi:hypothetical protein
VFPNVPAAATIAGTLATPFKPFLVSFANTMAMELKFLHRWAPGWALGWAAAGSRRCPGGAARLRRPALPHRHPHHRPPARRSFHNPKLQTPQRIHSAAALLGLGAFFLEDMCPQLPLCHATWHCLSALGCATTNAILADAEEQTAVQQQQRGAAKAGKGGPLLLEAAKPLAL